MNLFLTVILVFLSTNVAGSQPAIFSAENNRILNPGLSTLIFIHGSPGTSRTFNKYLNDPKLIETFNLIAIDRPNYGKSKGFARYISMSSQAKLISAYLEKKFSVSELKTKTYIVSHSYGAPLSVLIERELKSNADLIMMAGPFDPKLNMVKWYNTVAKLSFVSLFLGPAWVISNKEMLGLNKNLQKVKSYLSDYTGVTHFLHGSEDGIVSISHSKWAHQFRLKNNKKSHLAIYPSNHFFVWSKFKIIKDYILNLR